jgi:Ring hydroxylating alpha subunit (catalytic domain)
MSCFRALPTSDPSTTIMEFDYYHAGTDAEFEDYFRFVRQVALEDFELCEKAQGNLERGIYGEGILNPMRENGVTFYQGRVREMVYRQLENERDAMLMAGCEWNAESAESAESAISEVVSQNQMPAMTAITAA